MRCCRHHYSSRRRRRKEAGEEVDKGKDIYTEGEDEDKEYDYGKEDEDNYEISVPQGGSLVKMTRMTTAKTLLP